MELLMLINVWTMYLLAVASWMVNVVMVGEVVQRVCEAWTARRGEWEEWYGYEDN